MLTNHNPYILKKNEDTMFPQIPPDYYAPSALGCVMGINSLLAFSSGIYRGVCEAHGTPMSPSLENTLLFGPSILSIPLSFSQVGKALSDPRITSQMPPMPEEAKGCSIGCGVVSGAIGVGLVNGLGYLVGSYIGRHS
jgi:hypothetical protein